MKAFDIGFIPEGWERGDKLLISKAGPRCCGFVAQHIDALFAEGPTACNPLHVARVDFTPEQTPAVDAWLAWWFEKV